MDSYVKLCPHCEQYVPQAKEPLITTPLPSHPWMFLHRGIPALLVSNNGPQYISREMQEFAEQYSFTHNTSSRTIIKATEWQKEQSRL